MLRTVATRVALALIVAMLSFSVLPVREPHPALEPRRFLSSMRPAVREAAEILIIEGQKPALDSLESAEWAGILSVLLECGARQALIPRRPDDGGARVLDAAWRSAMDRSIEREYSSLKDNVSSLFEGIRQGSIRAKDGPRFVDGLLALADQSATRLRDMLYDEGNTGQAELERAVAAFGGGNAGTGPEALGYTLPVVEGSAILCEYPAAGPGGTAFRRLSLDAINQYIAADQRLTKAIVALEAGGYLAQANPDAFPPALGDHARALRARFLESPGSGNYDAWISSRIAYLAAVADLLGGEAETLLLRGYEQLMTGENLGQEGQEKTRSLMDEASAAFRESREALAQLVSLRRGLLPALGGSICVLGEGPAAGRLNQDIWKEPSAPEGAAVIINAALTGSHIRMPTGRFGRAWLLVPGVVAAFALAWTGPTASLLLGMLLGLAGFFCFGALYVFGGLWFDPASGMIIALSASAASLAALGTERMRIRDIVLRTFGDRLPGFIAGSLVASPAQVGRAMVPHLARAAVMAIRMPSLESGSGKDATAGSETEGAAFHEHSTRLILEQGGIILGAEDNIVFAGFGTPIEIVGVGAKGKAVPEHIRPADRALRAAMNIAGADAAKAGDWRIGVDSGSCRFFVSRLQGYTAIGRPLVYSRLLSGLAPGYGETILLTRDLLDSAGESWETRRLDSLVRKDSGEEEAFYALTGTAT